MPRPFGIVLALAAIVLTTACTSIPRAAPAPTKSATPSATAPVIRPATRADLIGTWTPEPASPDNGGAHITFARDGSYQSQDTGCNHQYGRWSVSNDGTYKIVPGINDLSLCTQVRRSGEPKPTEPVEPARGVNALEALRFGLPVGRAYGHPLHVDVNGSDLVVARLNGEEIGKLERTSSTPSP